MDMAMLKWTRHVGKFLKIHTTRVSDMRVVSDTFGTRHGSMIELTLLHRLMIQEFICNDLKLEVSDQILVVCFNACFSITF